RANGRLVIGNGHAFAAKGMNRYLKLFPQFNCTSNVVRMAVCNENPANAPATFSLTYNGGEMRRMRVGGIDYQRPICIVATQDERICTWSRHERGIGGENTGVEAIFHYFISTPASTLCSRHVLWYNPAIL